MSPESAPLIVFRSPTKCLYPLCLIRKIKCDEARPGCQRCIGTGRKCDGYGDTDSATKQTLIIQERPPITRALNNDLGVELSLHAFDYYRGHVSHQVGDTVDSDFWGDLVLRLAPTDAAIRHAISAISLMYAEKTKDTRDICPNYRPAILEYIKAILAVRSWPLATESRVKPLLVCLLFVCIEFMLGHEHQNAAKMHILQGRRLLANIEDRKTPETDIIRQYLAPIYLRLAYVVVKGANEETSDNEEDTLQSRYKHLTRELANWRHAFEAYLAFSDLDGSDTRTTKLLTQRHCLMIVFLDSMIPGSDYVCDRNGLCDFSIATDCASFVVNYDNDSMQGPSFTFESEVVGPIYWIAAKCRQPVIRRRALELLYEREKTNRVESLTMVRHTIAMATRVIEIEEEGLEIPLGTKHIQDYPNKYEVISREESCEWAESFLTDQKEQWPVLWDLGSHCSDIPTKLTRITATREQKELAEGLAKGWPRERLIWPYGIIRERRVLSVVVKKHTADDLWLEYVREPLTAGGEYRVMKEHIRFL
ncbi:C6 zinc finger domain-containing protein [Fusarium circinatum]|uniref:C6 zinc finger domain-containing protein n=1 Tax=Fusarium circinatum TaxID=48490 RepID=A0A8H5X3B9_FUSCI|nr:C6 zinc finger domain-containing protein [Fusarium circinatum]